MKRDDDYIRELLLEAEEDPRWRIQQGNPGADEPEAEKRYFHYRLLCDAGLMEMEKNRLFRITNSGHDYLSSIRDDNIWKKTKEGAAKVGGMTLGMMADLALVYLKQEAAGKLGIQL